MSAEPRSLAIEFASEEAFREEYRGNISMGGIFIATRTPPSLRTPLRIEIRLLYSGARIRLDGEAVHVVPPELAETGATPGVAVQFRLPASRIREKLRPLIGEDAEPGERRAESGRRSASRARARVDAELATAAGVVLRSRTRNLSATGALVSCSGEPLPVGTPVRLALTHPTEGETRTVAGRVVRHLVNEEAQVTALGIEFDVPPVERDEVARFIAAIKASEHSRRLGGISGDLSELGPENILQMFGGCSPRGTLTFSRGAEEGLILFEGGQLVHARVGDERGEKALARMLSWDSGSFEFEARLDPLPEDAGEPVSLSAAILEAVRRRDEAARSGDPSEAPRSVSIDRSGRLRALGASEGDANSQVEQAVLELARVGMGVSKVLEIIPEPEGELLAAIGRLVATGQVAIDS